MSFHPAGGGWEGGGQAEGCPFPLFIPCPPFLPKGLGLVRGVWPRNGFPHTHQAGKSWRWTRVGSDIFSSPTFPGPAGFGRLGGCSSSCHQPPPQCRDLPLLLAFLSSICDLSGYTCCPTAGGGTAGFPGKPKHSELLESRSRLKGL